MRAHARAFPSRGASAYDDWRDRHLPIPPGRAHKALIKLPVNRQERQVSLLGPNGTADTDIRRPGRFQEQAAPQPEAHTRRATQHERQIGPAGQCSVPGKVVHPTPFYEGHQQTTPKGQGCSGRVIMVHHCTKDCNAALEPQENQRLQTPEMFRRASINPGSAPRRPKSGASSALLFSTRSSTRTCSPRTISSSA